MSYHNIHRPARAVHISSPLDPVSLLRDLRDLDDRLTDARRELAAARAENAEANGNPDLAFITDRGERAWDNLRHWEHEVDRLTARRQVLADEVAAARGWAEDLLRLTSLSDRVADLETTIGELIVGEGR